MTSPQPHEEGSPTPYRKDSGSGRLPVFDRFLIGEVEHTLSVDLGIADPGIAGHLSMLVLRYSIREPKEFNKLVAKDVSGELSRRIVMADRLLDIERRTAFIKIGDAALFWYGFFANSEIRSRHAEVKNCALGAYQHAHELDVDGSEPDNRVLERLHDEFDLCVYGLSEVKRNLHSGESDRYLIF
ncbi:MAG: hypothetical protein KDD62_11835 [Bdellovibrionales bacterium]|nr:hypothetical protein [Bdellovibrionales bacterium]